MKDISIFFNGESCEDICVIESNFENVAPTILTVLSKVDYLMFSNIGGHYDKLIFHNAKSMREFLSLKNNIYYNHLYIYFNFKEGSYNVLDKLVSLGILRTNSIYINGVKYISTEHST